MRKRIQAELKTELPDRLSLTSVSSTMKVSAEEEKLRSEEVDVFFSSSRRHTIWPRDWSSDVCSSDLDRHCGKSHDGCRDQTNLSRAPGPFDHDTHRGIFRNGGRNGEALLLNKHRVGSPRECRRFDHARSEERREGESVGLDT